MSSQTADGQTWYKDKFFISTSRSLLQPAAINAAFGSDTLYWAKTLNEDVLKKALDTSLCFGVYALPSSSSEIAGRSNPRQIGLARLITDRVTTAYLTDVYVLDEYQGHGLGTWLIDCVSQELDSWPHLRRSLLITSSGEDFYAKHMGMTKFEQGKDGVVIMSKRHVGSTMSH